MQDLHLWMFLLKLVVVFLTLSVAFYRIEGFQPKRIAGHKLFPSTNRINRSWRIRTLMSDQTDKDYAPSQVIVDEATGDKWRLCSGVAVLNSQNQLLIGERKERPGSWQCPQGGVDDEWTPNDSNKRKAKETIVEAAAREMYEEIGLELGIHAMIDPTFPMPSLDRSNTTGVRYSTTAGSSNWLSRSGFAGQELHWTFFRCTDGRGDFDPNFMCDVSGNNGEAAEFARVKWLDVDSVVEGIWEGKRAPYLLLQSLMHQHGSEWEGRIHRLGFAGKWSRDSKQCVNLVEGLMARGLTQEEATAEAIQPYIQTWQQDLDDRASWHVTTYQSDGMTARRTLEYKPGYWEETFQGKSTLFGDSDSTITLKRRTHYVGEMDAEPHPIAQVTITESPKGTEESRRYRKGDFFHLWRTLWPKESPEQAVVSTEVFTRC